LYAPITKEYAPDSERTSPSQSNAIGYFRFLRMLAM